MLADQQLSSRETTKRSARKQVVVNQSTVIRDAHRRWLRRVKEVDVPLLTPAQELKHVESWQAHADEDWKKFLFTDESHFLF